MNFIRLILHTCIYFLLILCIWIILAKNTWLTNLKYFEDDFITITKSESKAFINDKGWYNYFHTYVVRVLCYNKNVCVNYWRCENFESIALHVSHMYPKPSITAHQRIRCKNWDIFAQIYLSTPFLKSWWLAQSYYFVIFF